MVDEALTQLEAELKEIDAKLIELRVLQVRRQKVAKAVASLKGEAFVRHRRPRSTVSWKELIANHPGSSAGELAMLVGRETADVCAALGAGVKRGTYKREYVDGLSRYWLSEGHHPSDEHSRLQAEPSAPRSASAARRHDEQG